MQGINAGRLYSDEVTQSEEGRTVAQSPALSTPSARRWMRVLPAPSGRRAQGGACLGSYTIIDRQNKISRITLISIETIVLIMPTTITINERTKERLSDYKFGDWTFDDVLNMLMNKVSIEDISAEHIREHYRRLADFKGLSKEEFKSRIKKRASSGS